MKTTRSRLFLMSLFSLNALASATSPAFAQKNTPAETAPREFKFNSPNGVVEICRTLPHIPGGDYSEKDGEREAKLCKIDFYSEKVALCPKFWSTSAATMVFANKDTGLTQSQYETQRCPNRRGHDKIAKLKVSMDADGTSAVFSTSSILYYHLSRYFDTSVEVPVAVYRSMDRDIHLARVSSKSTAKGGMIRKAWDIRAMAEQDPNTYPAKRDIFTPDLKQIYGALLHDHGEEYGAEVNGLNTLWGEQASLEFQETAPFLALRSELPLAQAIESGLAQARQNPILNQALGPKVHPVQMAFWMKELTEITLLDYIFIQQDRVPNIDYTWSWYWIENGEVQSEKADSKVSRREMGKIKAPAEIAAFNPILLQRTHIGDNDGGGRVHYANFTKRTQMLEKIRHMSAKTYRLLVNLNKDLGSSGPVFKYIKNNFDLNERALAQIVKNTSLATQIYKQACEAGQLRFDLEPKALLLGKAAQKTLDCSNP